VMETIRSVVVVKMIFYKVTLEMIHFMVKMEMIEEKPNGI